MNKEEHKTLGNIDFQNQLIELGFKHLGFGWYSNEKDTIRIRLWKDSEIDFWIWRSSDENADDNEIHFRGKIYNIDEVKWVLERCFNNQ
jgi:hypothetical protein